MTDHRPPPPQPEGCLMFARASRYKGGTRIAEHVHDLATHMRLVVDPGGYRPDQCLHCLGHRLHVHKHLVRVPRGESGMPPVIDIVSYRCANRACGATWRILPAFLARHLWRVWPTVERTALPVPSPASSPSSASSPSPASSPRHTPIPKRTVQRWRGRLASAAVQLVVLLATSGGALLESIAACAGHEGTRRELVEVHAQVAGTPPRRRLADLAGLVDRLERGIRLM